MTSTPRMLLPAALFLILLAAACGEADPSTSGRATTTASDTTTTTTEPGTTTTTTAEATDAATTTTASASDTTTTSGTSTTTTTTTTTTTPTTTTVGHHGAAGEPTRYDAPVSDADQTISVEIVGGDPVGGHQRVRVDLNSVVALMVTSDIAAEIHVHSYDILRAVSDGHPAHFAFTAEIPGVFEVELEGSGRLLLLLEIS